MCRKNTGNCGKVCQTLLIYNLGTSRATIDKRPAVSNVNYFKVYKQIFHEKSKLNLHKLKCALLLYHTTNESLKVKAYSAGKRFFHQKTTLFVSTWIKKTSTLRNLKM